MEDFFYKFERAVVRVLWVNHSMVDDTLILCVCLYFFLCLLLFPSRGCMVQLLSGEYKSGTQILQIRCPSYYLNFQRKSALIQ